ncbi:MAG: methionine synthase [Bacilli bacterium]|nr:methionine synthase [Bacilli bacterium]
MANWKYDIVGSFLRPKEIRIAREKYKDGEITYDQLRKIEDEVITKLVDKEVAHGLKRVTDGEFRRRWWHLDWSTNAFNGWDTIHLDRVINGVSHHIELGYVSGKISYVKDNKEIQDYVFLKKLADERGVEAKKNISGPNMLLIDEIFQMGHNEHAYYGNDTEALIEDIAKAYQEAFKDLYEKGCRFVQVDDTSWTYIIDDRFMMKVLATGHTREEVIEWFVKVTNKSLENKPEGMTIATHFCKGNFKGKGMWNGFYDAICEGVKRCNYDVFFVEYDDERSGSFDPWKDFPKGKTFVVGLISTKKAELESKDFLRNRYLQASSIITDNLAISPQCGFASVEEGNDITEADQWAKIDLLVSAAHDIN